MYCKIENSNIALRAATSDEVDYIFDLEARPENSRFVMPYTKERHLQAIDSPDEELLIISDKTSGASLGFVILAGLTNPDLSLEFRRMVIDEKGRGLGRQTVNLVKEYCFRTLRFHRLWLDVYEDNERGIHIYQSEGFKPEGKLRDVKKHGDIYRSLLLFSILENEFH
jgi:RimJ/RimL family protein N-acetyltransferase